MPFFDAFSFDVGGNSAVFVVKQPKHTSFFLFTSVYRLLLPSSILDFNGQEGRCP